MHNWNNFDPNLNCNHIHVRINNIVNFTPDSFRQNYYSSPGDGAAACQLSDRLKVAG